MNLKNSNLRIRVDGISCTPVGYADDMAAATLYKLKLDKVMNIVNSHGNKWRNEYNARKSAILVHRETYNEWQQNSKFRVFRLGQAKVHEKESYNVGVISTIPCSKTSPIDDRLAKGRKTLNAATGLGIKRNGLNMATCNLIFWNVVVPTTLYGCELWVLSDEDICKIDKFQKQAGKRIQTFSPYSSSYASYYSLGWMDLCTFICAKKLIFIHTIIRQDDSSMIKGLLKARAEKFNENIALNIQNNHRSPIYEILKISYNFGIYNCLMKLIFGRTYMNKDQ